MTQSQSDKLEQLRRNREEARLGGGEKAIARQHERGKLTARERIDLLLDAGSFVEIDALVRHLCTDFDMEKKRIFGDGVVTGHGMIDGRPVFVFSQDFTVFGGSLSERLRGQDLQDHGPGREARRPGDRPQRLRRRAHPGGRREPRRLRRHLPAEHAGFRRRAADLRRPRALRRRRGLLPRDHRLHLHGRRHVAHVRDRPERREDGHPRGHSFEELGGARTHASRSGVSHFTAPNDAAVPPGGAAPRLVPAAQQHRGSPRVEPQDDRDRREEALDSIVPEDPESPYDMHDVIGHVVDDGDFLEVHADYAQNILVGFARLGGRPVGIIANQPAVLAGCSTSRPA
jgi:acetyl-CoA carboxylase carboxyltransferase component